MATDNVSCPCGATLKVKSEHAGKKVRCPKCRQAVMVPDALAAKPRTAVRVSCPCGKGLKVQPELVGKRVRCPACGCGLMIKQPSPRQPVIGSDPLDLGGLDGDLFGGGSPAASVLGTRPLASAPIAHFLGPPAAAPGLAGVNKLAISNVDWTLMAGCVAIFFGGWHAYVGALDVLLFVASSCRSLLAGELSLGLFSGVNGFAVVGLVLHLVTFPIFLALAIWLAISGVNIVRNAQRDESFENAVQASILWIAISALLLALSALQLLGSSSAGSGFIWRIFGMVTRGAMVTNLAPAFIIGANYMHKNWRQGV